MAGTRLPNGAKAAAAAFLSSLHEQPEEKQNAFAKAALGLIREKLAEAKAKRAGRNARSTAAVAPKRALKATESAKKVPARKPRAKKPVLEIVGRKPRQAA